MNSISIYLFFHLNISFSSIEENERELVVKRCYWPLLKMIEVTKINIGIEASAYTLEVINSIDPSWIDKLRNLCDRSLCTFIGSGYCQLIGPIIPAKVNKHNYTIATDIYKNFLGQVPTIGLVNEQAWSKGMVDNFIDAGYEAVIMEWDNPSLTHPQWHRSLQYYPQYGCGTEKRKIKLIWNKSLSFQKLQRYIHGDISFNEYNSYLKQPQLPAGGFFSLYGNDAEIFNFRPGRFATESKLAKDDEWLKLSQLLLSLQKNDRFNFVSLQDVLNFKGNNFAWNKLDLQGPNHPIPVKKQPKYNICRWAVTGRDDTAINSSCYTIFNRLQTIPKTAQLTKDWKTLCYMWSSDFRTHITKNRFNTLQKLISAHLPQPKEQSAAITRKAPNPATTSAWLDIKKSGQLIVCKTPVMQISLNQRKGLAIDNLIFPGLSNIPLVRTLAHGYFDNIAYGADFFTGHLVFNTPGIPQITDLQPVEPVIYLENDCACIVARIKLPAGDIKKTISFKKNEESVTISYSIDFKQKPHGTIRLGHTTLNPEFFDKDSLHFSTHNGGKHLEYFQLNETEVEHFRPVSPIVSSTQALGETEGIIEIGDKNYSIFIKSDKSQTYSVGGIHFVPIGNSYLLRHIFSILETDDTNNHLFQQDINSAPPRTFSFSISSGPG